jgi:flavin reductase (DIM6/NTAB) family NADH-FMN oxidoreductase RutF
MGTREAYQLLIDSIVPRPIAWLTTRAADGTPNLAPFSFFTGVTAAPPVVVVNIAPRVLRDADGGRTTRDKDTLANLRATGEFVVHVAPRAKRSEVVLSAAAHPPELDEIALAGLATVPGTWVDVPRITELPLAMECRVLQLVPVGRLPATMVLGQVLGWHVHDELVDAEGRVPSVGWGPLGRLGVEGYQD